MKEIHYYLTLFPTEALIASQLEPEQFGSYMATASNRGAYERLIFAEVSGGFGTDFDWAYAQEKCAPHPDGRPKHSVYLAVYRVLERIPFSALGKLWLTTSDGRSLALEARGAIPDKGKPYHIYQELCPIQPLVVSKLAPSAFAGHIVGGESKIMVPSLFFCDLKVIDLNDLENTGNIGSIYDRNIYHLRNCIKAVTEQGKTTKTLDRTFASSFSFQIIKDGLCFARAGEERYYPMPSAEQLGSTYYDWARSAMIL